MSNPRLSIIPAAAVLDPRLKARDLQVLCVFGRHTDRAGWCCRSQVKMAREIGCARSTLQAAIERLVEAGWIEKRILSTPHEAGERDRSHEYRVVLDTPDRLNEDNPDPADWSAPSMKPATPADRSAPLPDQSRHPLPVHGPAPMLTTPSLTKSSSEPKPEPNGERSSSDVDDLDNLQEQLLQAAGDGKIQPHGAINLSAILGLIQADVDLQTDILPTIRAVAARMKRPASSWDYFTRPIREAYETRINAGKGLAKSQTSTVVADADMAPNELLDTWRKRLGYARPRRQWHSASWGPMPGQDGCRVPSELLIPTDGKWPDGAPWSDQDLGIAA